MCWIFKITEVSFRTNANQRGLYSEESSVYECNEPRTAEVAGFMNMEKNYAESFTVC